MNLLLHHLRKDLRFARWLILISLVLAAGVLWFPSVPLEERPGQIKWLYLSQYGIWLLTLLTAGQLIQLDAPLRESGFMRTRPAPRTTVLLSKMIAVLVLIVPLAMIECLLLVLLDLKPGATNLVIIFAENLLMLALIGSVGMALAIRQESTAKFNASVVGWIGIGVIGWIAFTWGQSAYFRMQKPEWSRTLEYLKTSRLFMAQIVALTGAVIGIVLFARSGRREIITRSLAFTALCALATLFFWPVNFVEAFVPAGREAPRNEWPDQTKLKFSFGDPPDGLMPKKTLSFNNGGYNGMTYRSIHGWYRLEGLSNGWITAQNSYESELKLANGRVLTSHQSAWAPISKVWILSTLGIKAGWGNPYDYPSNADLAEFNLADAAGAMSGASLKGHMNIPIKRPILLQRIRLKAGVSTHVGGHLISITKVGILGDEISFNLIVQTPLNFSRGGWQKIWTDRIEYLVINAARGEYLANIGGGESNPHSGHLSVRNLDFSQSIFPQHERKEITPDWLDGAELLIVGEEYGGSFSQSFDFPNINLSDER
jgi:hypothetical protein